MIELTSQGSSQFVTNEKKKKQKKEKKTNNYCQFGSHKDT